MHSPPLSLPRVNEHALLTAFRQASADVPPAVSTYVFIHHGVKSWPQIGAVCKQPLLAKKIAAPVRTPRFVKLPLAYRMSPASLMPEKITLNAVALNEPVCFL